MSNTLRRLIPLALFVFILAGLALPAAATGNLLATEDVTEEVTEEAPAVEYDGPDAFVPVTETAEEELDPAWTYKYLIPTTMVLISLLVVGLVVGYFLRVVRTRYTVVE